MSDFEQKPDILPRRLCSEIQLFDLCELASCGHKSGRYCTNSVMLGRFENIAEDELRTPERYVSEEFDDADADDGDECDDAFVIENFEGIEDGGWEDEV